MSSTFATNIRILKAVATQFDPESNAQKLRVLQAIAKCELKTTPSLVTYADLLLFLQAMPPDRKVLLVARNEMARVTRVIKSSKHKVLLNSGLPYTEQVSTFSHDLIAWLLTDPKCHVELDRFEEGTLDLHDVLAITLPSLERSETTSGYSHAELLEALGVAPNNTVSFLVNELTRLDDRPRVKDLLFSGLGLFVTIRPKDRSISRAYNVFTTRKPFLHKHIIKDFDQRELLDRALPKRSDLTAKQKLALIRTLKLSMVLTDRETDPITHLDDRTIQLYDLENGVSIAIYGMYASRQMPLESYIGYTLFMNGFPAAYGGSWVFGERADFGINIFESFRGAGSGYLMCQLLRVFRQVFEVDLFEIEPYQFGLDNPDGIATGAYWFYYKHGFRSKLPELRALAEKEVERRSVRKSHRTSVRTLTRFTEGNMVLALCSGKRTGVYDIAEHVKRLIRTRYKGNRTIAEAKCVEHFIKLLKLGPIADPDRMQVLREVAMWAEAMRVRDPGKLKLLHRMTIEKPKDPYRYQELLLAYFQ